MHVARACNVCMLCKYVMCTCYACVVFMYVMYVHFINMLYVHIFTVLHTSDVRMMCWVYFFRCLDHDPYDLSAIPNGVPNAAF